MDSFGHLLNQLRRLHRTSSGTQPEDFGRMMTIRAGELTATVAPYDIVRKMRASILVLGPLIGRAGEATVSLPGGCAIGNRPIDLHLQGAGGARRRDRAHRRLCEGRWRRAAGLPGGRVTFPIVSVGATENALMAAVPAKGASMIENAAREPEIVDLCNLLVAMGASIAGIGTETLEIEGATGSHGATYTVMPDRIEAGS